MRRGPYVKVVERNAQLLERIRDLKAEHPFWGYRRIWAYLRYVDGLIVNQKRIYGVMKVAEVRDLAVDDLRQRVKELDDQLFRLRIQKSMGQIEAAGKLKALRRDLARVQTVLREKETA